MRACVNTVGRCAAATVLFNSLLGMRHIPQQFSVEENKRTTPSAASCSLFDSVVECSVNATPATKVLENGSEALSTTNDAAAVLAATRVLIVTDAQPCTLGVSIRDAYLELLRGGEEGAGEEISEIPNPQSQPAGLIQHAVMTFDPKTFHADVVQYFGLGDAGESNLPKAEDVKETNHKNVVILIENGAFQNELHQYRLRLELFRLGIRVAEHCHLRTMSGTSKANGGAKGSGGEEGAGNLGEIENYFRACSLNPFVAEEEGRLLRTRLGASSVPLSQAKALLSGVPLRDVLKMGYKDTSTCSKGAVGGLVSDPPVALYDLVITSGKTRRDQVEGRGGEEVTDEHSLVFTAGLEPCLLNTGLYAAASLEAAAEAALSAPIAPREGNTLRDLKKEDATNEEMNASAKKRKKKAKSNNNNGDDTEETAAARPSFTPSPATVGTQQRSVGGTFPIGEVITESVDLGAVHGSAAVFAFPTVERRMCIINKNEGDGGSGLGGGALLEVKVENGRITQLEDPTESGALSEEKEQLQAVLDLISAAEGSVLVRELGIGINPYLGRGRPLSDVTSFERQRGIHLSLGMRHPLFPKKARRDVELILPSTSTTAAAASTALQMVAKANGSSYPINSGPEKGGEAPSVTTEEAARGTPVTVDANECSLLAETTRRVPQIGPVLRRKDGMFHIDMFIAAKKVILRPKPMFRHVLEEEVLMRFD